MCFWASAHCTCELRPLSILATNLLALYVVSLTEGTPLHYSCHMAVAHFHTLQGIVKQICVWFACSSPEARKHVNFFFACKSLAHMRLTPDPKMLVASLSNPSGTAPALAFPLDVDTTTTVQVTKVETVSIHLLTSAQTTQQSTDAKNVNRLMLMSAQSKPYLFPLRALRALVYIIWPLANVLQGHFVQKTLKNREQ